MSLLELMVAVAVLAIGLLALLGSMTFAVRLSRATRETNAASFTLHGSEIVIRVELEDRL